MKEKDLPSFDERHDESGRETVSSLSSLATETIDLSGLMPSVPAEVDDFEGIGIRDSSFGRFLGVLPVPALVIGGSTRIVFCNDAFARISADYRSLEGDYFASLFRPGDEAKRSRNLVQEIFNERKPRITEQKLLIHGKPIWTRIYFRSIRLGDERVLLGLLEDLTLEKRQVQLIETVTRARNEWERTFNTLPDLVATIDRHFRIIRMNDAMAGRTGVSVSDAVGMECFRVFHGLDQPPSFCVLPRLLSQGEDQSVEYYESRHESYYRETVSPIRNDEGDLVGCVHVARDISEHKRLEAELKYQATHDSLTKLLNRSHTLELMAQAVESSKRYGVDLSLCLCDLDDFKVFNDRYGHQAGDYILETFGEIVRQQTRSADPAGRYGGDEFVIAFPSTPITGAIDCMERILNRFRETRFRFGGDSFSVTCTAGIAEYGLHIKTAADLIQAADQALYEAKRMGRNRIVVSGSTD
jgi:diguanylate cyclase (GGDEF)-like protein/PAS domain S-box-containing protein